MDDKFFWVSIERSRIYWDYYKSMFFALSMALVASMVSVAIIYTTGAIDLLIAVGLIMLIFLLVLLLIAVMSLFVWRHENKHLDELFDYESQEFDEPVEPAQHGEPLV